MAPCVTKPGLTPTSLSTILAGLVHSCSIHHMMVIYWNTEKHKTPLVISPYETDLTECEHNMMNLLFSWCPSSKQCRVTQCCTESNVSVWTVRAYMSRDSVKLCTHHNDPLLVWFIPEPSLCVCVTPAHPTHAVQLVIPASCKHPNVTYDTPSSCGNAA